MFKYSNIWIFEYSNIRISEYSNVRIWSDIRMFEVFEYSGIQIFRYSAGQIFRYVQICQIQFERRRRSHCMGIHAEIVSCCSYPYLTSTRVWANCCNTQSVHQPASHAPHQLNVSIDMIAMVAAGYRQIRSQGADVFRDYQSDRFVLVFPVTWRD